MKPVDSELSVAEEAASRAKAQAEVAVPDPPIDEAELAVVKASLKKLRVVEEPG